MNSPDFRYVYGPVPSRRLGRSLGLDLVPFKTCTYDCIYCQLGRTTCRTTDRTEYVPVTDILVELRQKLAEGPAPDFVTLAGSGEPTLSSDLGEIIRASRKLVEAPIAVITNSTLLSSPNVRREISAADIVLPTLDAATGPTFQAISRPGGGLRIEEMIEGFVTS